MNKSNLKQTVKLKTTLTTRTSDSNSNSNSSSDSDISYHVSVVDETTHDGPWKEFIIQTSNNVLTLKPFAVAVVRILDGAAGGGGGIGVGDGHNKENAVSRG